MVEKKEWKTDPLASLDRVDESGAPVRPITIPFKQEQLLSHAQKPVSLYDQLNPTDNRKPKGGRNPKPPTRDPSTLVWPGTSNEDE